MSVDGLLEGVQIIAFDWTYRYLNGAAARHGQRDVKDLVGRTMMACYPGIEHTPVFATMRRVMDSRQAERVRNEFTYPSGESRWFDLVIEPSPEGICVLSIDVTDEHHAAERQRALDAQLQQAQKMEALGQLAGGIAHDFNNLLTQILGYCDLLTDSLGEDPRAADVREVRKASDHAAALTRDLLAFSRKQVPELRVLDLNAVISDSARMLARLLGETIDMDVRLNPALGRIKADPTHVNQILMNLVANARDAMPDGGKLTVETRNTELDEEYRSTHLDARPGRYVQLAVTDTGQGMTPEVQAHLFEPFFTTKAIGKGTGLGLASVHGIVKQSGGNIWVYSEPGRGTTFKVHLPRVDDAVESPAPPDEPPSVTPATVLIVEDNEALLALATRILERDRYDVLAAGSGDEALRIAGTHPGPIDLLLADVVMPGRSGPALAQEILQARPGLAVVHMSGYTDDAVVRHGIVDAAVTFVQKPFTPDGLLRKVREALARVRSRAD
jgi:signal transduction histidine kinase/ActR/RegA family two-component response regulator